MKNINPATNKIQPQSRSSSNTGMAIETIRPEQLKMTLANMQYACGNDLTWGGFYDELRPNVVVK